MNEYLNYTIEELDKALNDLSSVGNSLILIGTDVGKQRELLMNAKNTKILETYPIRIWQTADGTWKAHVPDETKDRKRKLLQGKTKENLENRILENYKKHCDERLLFKNYFANWLINHKKKTYLEGTINRNLTDYENYVQGTPIDSMRITEITTLDIKNFLNDIINKHHLTEKGLSNLRSIFNGMFQHACEVGDVQKDPTYNLKIVNSNIRVPKKKTGKTEVFNEKESYLLTEYIFKNYLEIQPMISLAILLNFQLGLRVGELCTLKKSDVSFEDREIIIQRTERSYRPLELVDGKIVKHKTVYEIAEGETKCKSNRIIFLSDEAILIIKESLKYQEEHNIESEFLFPHTSGEHIIRDRYNEILEHYCKKVSIKRKSIHKTRKTVLTKLFESGMGLDEIMKISGHRNKQTLIEYYLYSTKTQEKERERFSKALSTGRTFSS